MAVNTFTGALPVTAEPELPDIVWLHERRARDRRTTGAKAATLAIARQEGMPVIDGFVVTTLGTSALGDPGDMGADRRHEPLRRAWTRISADGARSLAVRSSSVIEDGTTSSMAGRFVSVLDVRGWDAFVAAVFEVIASAAATELADAPMAVLVQPMAESAAGGVLFGVDPLTGDASTLRLSFAEGGADQIVGGTVSGTQVTLTRRGAVRTTSEPLPDVLGRKQRVALAALARKAAAAFGGPQDIEWLVDRAGNVCLLQSRPITASALPPAGSHVLGPGPVAETFPDPLSPLERDLWLAPLDEGIREAVRLIGVVPRATLESRFVFDLGGRVAVDLDVLGEAPKRRGLWSRIDPRPGARRLLAAWRVGRLRVAFPAIAHDLVLTVDADLLDVPAVEQLDEIELLRVLSNAQRTLAALHAHEVLAGFLLDPKAVATAGASVALAQITAARASGLDDDAIIATDPTSLVLIPPRIPAHHVLPPTPGAVQRQLGDGDDPTAAGREALRMRARWVHELTAIAAAELGDRLASSGRLPEPAAVRDIPLDVLRDVVLDPEAVVSLSDEPSTPIPPLPARFRLAADGSIVPEPTAGDTIGVSPGRVEAVVTHQPADAAGKILVTPVLAPGLAAALRGAAGIVSETGSPLSHLAILAREYHVPVVVGFDSACAALPEGTLVRLDGSTGAVEILEPMAEHTADTVTILDTRHVGGTR